MLLCDYAEEINGKLYITGGGFNRIVKMGMSPTDITIAAMLFVPWSKANRKHQIALKLLTQDGNPVVVGEKAEQVLLAAELEVGRPPGLAEGTELAAPLTFNSAGLLIAHGR